MPVPLPSYVHCFPTSCAPVLRVANVLRAVSACVIGIAALTTPGTLHAQLTVNALELRMAAGNASDVRLIGVRNDAATTVQATITVEDWDRDELGVNRFLPAGSHPRSCAAALEVFPKSLVLQPGESANIRVSLDGANHPSVRNCWSIVFMENRATQESAGRQLSYNVRTGVKIYGESNTVRRDGMVEAMQIAPATSDTSPEQLLVAFRNAGDVQLSVKGNIEVRRADNSVVQRLPVSEFPVLPEQLRRVAVAVPSLPSGRYVLLALLDFGGTELIAGQLEYEVR